MRDLRLGPQWRLGDLDTTGWRAWARGAARLALAASLGMAIVMFFVESHRECSVWHHSDWRTHAWSTPRTHAAEIGVAPMVMLGLVLLGQIFAHRGRMLAGIIAGSIAAVVVLGVGLVMGIEHWRAHVPYDEVSHTATWLYVAGGLAAAHVAIEPLLAVAERKARGGRDPVFPAASVVKR